MYAYENMHWSQKGIFRSAEFHEIPPPISIRPQSELVRTHVVTVSCLPLQDDAYHRFLKRFFSSVTLTPCFSSPGLGRLATADHEGASPLANNEKKSQKPAFLTPYLSVWVAKRPFLGVDFFYACAWICTLMKICTDRKHVDFVQLNSTRFLHRFRYGLNLSSFGLTLLLWFASLFKMMPIIDFWNVSSLAWP